MTAVKKIPLGGFSCGGHQPCHDAGFEADTWTRGDDLKGPPDLHKTRFKGLTYHKLAFSLVVLTGVLWFLHVVCVSVLCVCVCKLPLSDKTLTGTAAS